MNCQAGAPSLWARWGTQAQHLPLDPLSTKSTARGPDSNLYPRLGQTQTGASSEAFPPCLMALSRWITPCPASSKVCLVRLWFGEAFPTHVHRGSWKVPWRSGRVQRLCLTSPDPGKTGAGRSHPASTQTTAIRAEQRPRAQAWLRTPQVNLSPILDHLQSIDRAW